jgi:hypothetical protein
MKVLRNNLDFLKAPEVFMQFNKGNIRAYEVEKTLFEHPKHRTFLLTDEPLSMGERSKLLREIMPIEIMMGDYFKKD